jgi:uncharacterized protein YprB with RNaseH-like and TPR domain
MAKKRSSITARKTVKKVPVKKHGRKVARRSTKVAKSKLTGKEGKKDTNNNKKGKAPDKIVLKGRVTTKSRKSNAIQGSAPKASVLDKKEVALLRHHQKLKLTIELVPGTSWYNNVRKILPAEQWDAIRKEVYRRASYICEICCEKGSEHPVECHEVWIYDDTTLTQKLGYFQALCPLCHEVKHIGLAGIKGNAEKAFERFRRINKLSEQTALSMQSALFKQHRIRSRKQWTLDIEHLKKWGATITPSPSKLNLKEGYISKRIISPTVFKKTFDRVSLIPHPLSQENEHPIEECNSEKKVHQINGIGGATLSKFHAAGIKTIAEFVTAGLGTISSVLGWSEKGGLPFYLRGLAIHENRVIKIKQLKVISATPIYLDIETDDLVGTTIWMIGIYISSTKEFIQLVADKPEDEKKIIRLCFEILSGHAGEQIISYSGSRFDERMLRNKFEKEGVEHSSLVFDDILIDLKASLALPISQYTLGNVADFWGYNFLHPNMNGGQVASLYLSYRKNLRRYSGYKKLCEYNEDDVKSMLSLVHHLYLNTKAIEAPLSALSKSQKRFNADGLTDLAELV